MLFILLSTFSSIVQQHCAAEHAQLLKTIFICHAQRHDSGAQICNDNFAVMCSQPLKQGNRFTCLNPVCTF